MIRTRKTSKLEPTDAFKKQTIRKVSENLVRAFPTFFSARVGLKVSQANKMHITNQNFRADTKRET